jgi:hypothetical protein
MPMLVRKDHLLLLATSNSSYVFLTYFRQVYYVPAVHLACIHHNLLYLKGL